MQRDVAPAPADRVIAILDALGRAGLDAENVLHDADIPWRLADLHGGEADNLSTTACMALARAATELVEREAARRNQVPPPAAHLQLMMWRSAMSCATLGNILGSLQLLSEVLNGAAGLGAVQIDRGTTTAVLSTPRSRRDPVSFLADLFLSLSMRNMLSWMIRKKVPLRAILLPYPPELVDFIPPGFVDCELLWDQACLAIRYPASLHESRVARTEDDLAELQMIAPLLLDEIGELGPFTAKIGRLLDDAISYRRPVPREPEIARELHCSVATLRRRLREEGTSLRAIKDHRRRQWAMLLLRRHSIPEVALRVGYQDETAFSRAFRLWAGESPSSFRAVARRNRSNTSPNSGA